MSTVRTPPQQSVRPHSTILSYLLVLVFAIVVSFFAGSCWSRGPMSPNQASQVAEGDSKTILTGATNNTNETTSDNVHIYFLLDRSGSMGRIAVDVIEGFNAFVKEQQLTSPNDDETSLTMTLIQFDSENPQEVVFSGRAIESVPPLTSSTFQPRSATPLYDALGRTISMAEKTNAANERIVVVTFSDGLENASKEHSRKSVFDRITTLRDAGWTFVFLGANQDSYNEGGGMGFNAANTQNFAFDREGTQRACQDVSTATKSMRYNVKKESRLSGKWYDNENFFEGSKSAEADYTSRRTSMLP